MKLSCDVARDLLPLYADEVCSAKSRELLEEHLEECPDCVEFLSRLRKTELESSLGKERETVLQYALRQFRQRSAVVGSAVSGSVLVPVLVLVGIGYFRASMGWISVVMAALCVAASVIAVPILVPEDKLFWTFCAFTASLMLLLGVTCLYTRGNWFALTASAVLFGLSVVFLPFVIQARPLQKLIGDGNRVLIVLCTDFALFINMLNMISSQGRLTLRSILFTLGVIALMVVIVAGLIRKGSEKKNENRQA